MKRREFLVAAGAAVAVLPDLNAGATTARSFPKGFLWGAATSGHQVEGNNVNSDIWLLENVKPTIFVEPSADADNSFALWPADLDLVRALGLNSYRFSLEWSRIEPEPGLFSSAMLDHYKALIEGCRSRGVTPVVTFNHYTTLDNFEWLYGFQVKFGLCSVDRTTFRRTPKPSAAVYGAIAQRNAV